MESRVLEVTPEVSVKTQLIQPEDTFDLEAKKNSRDQTCAKEEVFQAIFYLGRKQDHRVRVEENTKLL